MIYICENFIFFDHFFLKTRMRILKYVHKETFNILKHNVKKNVSFFYHKDFDVMTLWVFGVVVVLNIRLHTYTKLVYKNLLFLQHNLEFG